MNIITPNIVAKPFTKLGAVTVRAGATLSELRSAIHQTLPQVMNKRAFYFLDGVLQSVDVKREAAMTVMDTFSISVIIRFTLNPTGNIDRVRDNWLADSHTFQPSRIFRESPGLKGKLPVSRIRRQLPDLRNFVINKAF